MNRLIIILIFSFAFLFPHAHGQAPKVKTQKTAGGVEYKIFKANKGPRIGSGDNVFFKLKATLSDSNLYDTYKSTQNPYMNIIITENYRKGNFEDGLTLLTRGDSALLVVNADSFFNLYLGSPPPAFVRKGDPIYFYLKIDSIVTKKVLAERKAAEDMILADKQKNEFKLIEDYIKTTGKVFTKTSTGLYYVITKTTTGAKANKGDKVSAIYTGKLLDGKVFDSNKSSGQPFEFTLGAHMVIAGWDEIFGILNEGENATIVMPSSLGYGAQGAGGSIGPYSPLIFDVEFVKANRTR